jgi:hypothetical protein
MKNRENWDDDDDNIDESSKESPEDCMWSLELQSANAISAAQAAKQKKDDASKDKWNAEIARLRHEMRKLEPSVDRSRMKPLPHTCAEQVAIEADDVENAGLIFEEEGEDDKEGFFSVLETSVSAMTAPVTMQENSIMAVIDVGSNQKWTGRLRS